MIPSKFMAAIASNLRNSCGQYFASMMFPLKLEVLQDPIYDFEIYSKRAKQPNNIVWMYHKSVITKLLLCEMFRVNAEDLSACKTLILDEADEMLSMGFQDDIEAVMDELPTEGCQKLLFSATLPTWVNAIVERYLKKPTWIDVAQDPNGNTTNNLITHQCVSCPPSLRGDCIGDLCKIHAGAFGKTIVFVNTKNDCDELANHEKLKAIGAGILHGGILQHARDKTMESFRNGKIRCLVATDVAARGIDVPAVDLVVQTRPPQDLEAYVHRSGRTGRAGRKGTSVCFYSRAEEYLLRLIEHKKGIKMQRVGPPQAERNLGEDGMVERRGSQQKCDVGIEGSVFL